MQNIDKVPVFGWVVFLILGVLAIAAISFLIVAFIRRGGKFSVLGQTIEVSEDGKVQTIDTLGLTYIMKENCDKIQSLTAERLEDVIPDISYLTSGISPYLSSRSIITPLCFTAGENTVKIKSGGKTKITFNGRYM